MYVCRNCQQPINPASEVCPYCGADLTLPAAGETAKPPARRSAAKLTLLFVLVVGGIWAIIWFALPFRMQDPRPTAENAAIQALQRLYNELGNYANGAGNFPVRLESLGDPAQAAAQEAMTGGYTLKYTPEQVDADGNAHGYALVALPRNYGYRSFFIDQSGVIRATRTGRPANAQDPPLDGPGQKK